MAKALAKNGGLRLTGYHLTVFALLVAFLGAVFTRDPIWLGICFVAIYVCAVYLAWEIPWVKQVRWGKASSAIVIAIVVGVIAYHEWPQKTKPILVAEPTFAPRNFSPGHGVFQFSTAVGYNFNIVDTGSVAKSMSERVVLRLAASTINTAVEDAMWSDFVGSFTPRQTGNISMGSTGWFDTAWGDRPLTKAESEALTMPNPPMHLYMLGHAVYTDDLGNHTLDICQWLQQPFSRGVWRSCDGHNGIDWGS